jgi:hypothetical protein
MFALAGCASIAGGPDPVIAPNDEVNMLKPMFDSSQVLAYFHAQDLETRRAYRDQIITARLYASDIKFSEYTQNLTQELRSGAFGVDFASMLLSGVASVSDPGEGTKIMAGVDTVLKGGRQAFTKEILIDRTLPIIVTQMKSDRKRIASKIWDNLANYSDVEYPLPLALTHVNEYYQAGTINGALTSLGDNISVISARESMRVESDMPNVESGNGGAVDHVESHASIYNAAVLTPSPLSMSSDQHHGSRSVELYRDSDYVDSNPSVSATSAHDVNVKVNNFVYGEDENSKVLMSFLQPNGTLSNERNEKLKKWMTSHGISEEITMAAFINGASFSGKRQAVVKEFDLHGD